MADRRRWMRGKESRHTKVRKTEIHRARRLLQRDPTPRPGIGEAFRHDTRGRYSRLFMLGAAALETFRVFLTLRKEAS